MKYKLFLDFIKKFMMSCVSEIEILATRLGI